MIKGAGRVKGEVRGRLTPNIHKGITELQNMTMQGKLVKEE
jgi:hypothetical protein